MKKLFIIILCFLFGSVLTQAYENNLISFLEYCKDSKSNIEITDRKDVGEAGMEWGVTALDDKGRKILFVYGREGLLVVAYFIQNKYVNKANIAALSAGDPSFHVDYSDKTGCLCMIRYSWKNGESKSIETIDRIFQDAGKYIAQTIK